MRNPGPNGSKIELIMDRIPLLLAKTDLSVILYDYMSYMAHSIGISFTERLISVNFGETLFAGKA